MTTREPAPRARPLVRRAGTLLRFAERWWLFLGCLVGWQLVTSVARNPYFPPPSRIVPEAGRLWFSGPAGHLLLTPAVFDDILPSIGRLLLGWGISVVVGVTAGLAIGRSRDATEYCGGVLAFARAVPPPILVPVFLVLFKIGPQMEVFTIAFGTAWPILLHAMDGARSVEPLTMDVARIFHTPWYRRFVRVVLPAAAPRVFAGLRVSLSIGFILMIVSELVGVTSGIGYQLTYAEANGDLLQVWAWIVLVSALGYLANSALVVVEHRVLRGRRGATNQLGG